ncbi:hypothetical protein Anas_06342 [Armadillidium nasatum]|uniref:Ubiquitin carboxyl-terminal hydrolase MINDY n=1 Tax=Armadillidium nasatum TaxID=96803 RepID=A0A5N5SNU5_9CRUS|nr:hypothetical protein Anas_06342 [Armadillidium nasatum]
MEKTNRLSLIPDELLTLVWGPVVKQELFCRWSQGFIFSSDENTALIQTSGGPCAVIAPVQAFLLKNLINIYQLQQMRELDVSTVDKYLCLSLVELLSQCRIDVEDKPRSSDNTTSPETSASNIEGPFRLACLDDPLPSTRERSPSTPSELDDIDRRTTTKDHDLFHSCIRLRQFESKYDLEKYLESNLAKFKIEFGILLFLYSVILTRGINRVRTEMGEAGESLIDQSEGHGGQALINLLINGRAASYVWDGDKDVGGLKLSGIIRRPIVGFLTKMEHLHYVQVGWYLKNPSSIVWVLASETHLTVLYSWNQALITPDTECERAKQVLSWFDADGNKFLPRTQLKDVLSKLNLCTDEDFVEFMCKELDPESTGVILFHKFLETFYNSDQSYSPPDVFHVYHYNGLESSCPDNKIKYAEGIVTLQEGNIEYSNHGSEILSCLRTKWGNIDIVWTNFHPTLN